MPIKQDIFRSYDIRGAFPTEINKEIAFKVGQAFAFLIQKETGADRIKIAIGRDGRRSSPALAKEIKKGLIDQGAIAIDLGAVSTPTFYFAAGKCKYDGGIQVTASHLGGNFNGFKLTRRGAESLSFENGIGDLQRLIRENAFAAGIKKGKVIRSANILDEEIKFAQSFADLKKIKPLKVVVDAANGIGGPMYERLFSRVPCKLIKLNFRVDGAFPSHDPNPAVEKNNAELQKAVLKNKADIGIAVDGDGDRVLFVDEKGKTVEPAALRAMVAEIFLKGARNEKIIYDVRPGKATEEVILENGGTPIVSAVGNSFIKEKARQENALLGLESTGHFILRTKYGFFESPMIVVLKILQEMSKSGLSLSECAKPFQRYFHSGEINFKAKNPRAVFKKLKQKFGRNLKYDFDGLSFEFPDYWFNVRLSNTESKMRLNLEARTQEAMEKNVKIVSLLIK
ncbi:MAG: phosphomannomutase/phosphoglucomutase [Parcubacteria group bacterium]